LAVKVALEGDDQLRKLPGLDPFPFAKFRVLRRNIDIAVVTQEAGQVPVLVLSFPLATPKLAAKLFRQVVLQPFGTIGDSFDEVRRNAGFLLQLAKRRLPGIVFALVDLGFLAKLPSDTREEFSGVYDFSGAFERDYPWNAA